MGLQAGGEQPLILLIGPPNVGKSVLFNQLSGLEVAMANYPGTTVDYTEGEVTFEGVSARLIDVPGTYTLDAANEAEQVAVDMLEKDPDLVICVLDAKNLESSIYLALQVLQRRLPTVMVVNRVDLLAEEGKRLDVQALSEELQLPVLPTIAVSNQGIDKLRETIAGVLTGQLNPIPRSPEPRWRYAEEIYHRAVVGSRVSASTSRQTLGDAAMRPWPGILIAIAVLGGSFAVVVGLGMALRRFVLLPIFADLVTPNIVSAVEQVVPAGSLRNIMIGEYGFLTKGIEWPLTLVMPYVISFYLALSVLEDTGYMPRLGVLLDGLCNKIGLSGAGIVPLLLGYGCGIPAIMSTRALPSRKNRMMVALMVSLSVPCMAQTGAFISLLAAHSVSALVFVAFLSIVALIFFGSMLNFLLPGEPPQTVMEMPDMLLPRFHVTVKKLWMHTKHYLGDAVLPVIGGVAVAAVLYETGLMVQLGEFLSPVVSGWLHLPEDAAVPILLGVFRRELTVLPLMEMQLSTLQLTVGSVVALFYVPCVAMLAMLMREFNFMFAALTMFVTTSSAFVIGGVVAHLGILLGL